MSDMRKDLEIWHQRRLNDCSARKVRSKKKKQEAKENKHRKNRYEDA